MRSRYIYRLAYFKVQCVLEVVSTQNSRSKDFSVVCD